MATETRPKVFVSSSDVDNEALDLLKSSCEVDIWEHPGPAKRYALLKRVKDKDALFVLLNDKIDDQVLDASGSNLKVIGTMSVGYDHIDLAAVKRRNIKVGYTPDVLTDAVAELTVGLLLTTARRFFESHNQIISGGWGAWSPSWMNGMEIRKSVIGIIGLGRIGGAVAKILLAFKPSRILYTGTASKPAGDELGAEFVSLDRLLQDSDFVIVTCALTDKTKELLGAESFKKMKNTAIFINVSRGGLVNQDALIAALKDGQIKAAGLDVMTPEPLPKHHPLLEVPNLTLIPHIGSSTVVTRRDMAVLTARNIIAGLKGEPLPASIF